MMVSYNTTQYHNPEALDLNLHQCEILKYYRSDLFLTRIPLQLQLLYISSILRLFINIVSSVEVI